MNKFFATMGSAVRKTLIGLGAVASLAVGAAIADINVTSGAGTVIFGFTCFTTKNCTASVPITSAGVEIPVATSTAQGVTTAAPATTPTTAAAETEISLLKAVTNAAVTPLNNTSVAINVSTATTTQLVALSGTTLIYVTSYDVIAGGTGNITFVYGTGASCGTGTTSLTGAYPLTAQAGIAKGSGIGTILRVPAGNALCVTTSAAVQMSGSVSYQQF